MRNIWNNPKGFRVEEIKAKTFQVFILDEVEMNNVMKNGP